MAEGGDFGNVVEAFSGNLLIVTDFETGETGATGGDDREDRVGEVLVCPVHPERTKRLALSLKVVDPLAFGDEVGAMKIQAFEGDVPGSQVLYHFVFKVDGVADFEVLEAGDGVEDAAKVVGAELRAIIYEDFAAGGLQEQAESRRVEETVLGKLPSNFVNNGGR
jgi:hypothetical protein